MLEGGIFAVKRTEGGASVLYDTWLWLSGMEEEEGDLGQGPLACARVGVVSKSHMRDR